MPAGVSSCINCGASRDPKAAECPYCGTRWEVTPPKVKIDVYKQLLRAVENTSYDDEKVNIIRSLASRSHYTAGQVRRIAMEFSYDDERRRAIEVLAPYTHDVGMLLSCSDTFSYDDERAAMTRFVAKFLQKREQLHTPADGEKVDTPARRRERANHQAGCLFLLILAGFLWFVLSSGG